MTNDNISEELQVTFNPPLYLQRQRWILDVLRQEAVQSILDIGCGEGSLLQCLAIPAQFKPPINLSPTSSPFVSGPYVDLHLSKIHGLDPCKRDLDLAIEATSPPNADKPPFTGHERWRTREARWMPLEANLWEGGFENINDAFTNDRIDAIVASEVIEHLRPESLPLFAPVLLGYYRPRLVLLTTPNYTYNQRFSSPGEASPTGYPDPTGRTDRVFRHSDHKFEWTSDEWTKFCTDAALEFGYHVDVGGVGVAVEPDPWGRENTLGFASQVTVFRRLDGQSPKAVPTLHGLARGPGPILRAHHVHLTHPLTQEDLSCPPVTAEIHQAVKDAMDDNREGAMTFEHIWRQGVVSLKCRGDVAALVKAFEPSSLDEQEWRVVDYTKGWDAEIVWKKYVMPETSQNDQDVSQHSEGLVDMWSRDDEEGTQSSLYEDVHGEEWEARSTWDTQDIGIEKSAWHESIDKTCNSESLWGSSLDSPDWNRNGTV